MQSEKQFCHCQLESFTFRVKMAGQKMRAVTFRSVILEEALYLIAGVDRHAGILTE